MISVNVYNRSYQVIPEIVNSLHNVTDVAFETIMPGGMSQAQVTLTWDTTFSSKKLNGYILEILENGQVRWWGRIQNVLESYSQAGGGTTITITALSSWAGLAKRQWAGTYVPSASMTATWTGEQLLRVLLYGNSEDVAWIKSGSWPTSQLQSVSWTGNTVQDVVTELCRIGDSSSRQYSMVLLPPTLTVASPYSNGDQKQTYPYASTCDDTSDSIYAVVSNNVTATSSFYQRPNSKSYFCSASTSGCHAFVAIGVTGCNQQNVGAWFYLPYNSSSAIHELIQLDGVTGPSAVSVRITASDVLQVRTSTSAGAATNHNTFQILDRGSWHHVAVYGQRGATTGCFALYYDGNIVRSACNIDIYSTVNMNRVNFGLSASSGSSRSLYVDSWAISQTDRVSPSSAIGKSAGSAASTSPYEFLPIPHFFDTSNKSAYEVLLSVDDIVDGYNVANSLNGVYNMVQIAYNSGSYSAILTDASSVGLYGQMSTVITLDHGAASDLAAWYGANYLAGQKDAKLKMESFRIRSSPIGPQGQLLSLAEIRAGMRFTIRERPDLGNIYIGQTRYHCSDDGTNEELDITPNEPTVNISSAVSNRARRRAINTAK